MTQNIPAPDDGAVRLKTQSELLKEEEEQKAIAAQQEQMERAIQGQRKFVMRFATMNKLRVETFVKDGQRFCSLIDPKDKHGNRAIIVPSMQEQQFLQAMMQYVAELQQRAQNTGGQWEEAKPEK